MLIAFCSDSDRPVFRRLVRAIRDCEPDLVLFGGDLRAMGFGIGALRGRRWLRAWGPLVNRLVTVPGNHDYRPGSNDPWTFLGSHAAGTRVARFEDRAFVLHLPGIQVAGLDTGRFARTVDRDQLIWLRDQLAGDNADHRIACFHSPAFPTSTHIGSSLDADRDSRDELWETLEDLGFTLVINGHEHLYARRTIHAGTPIVQVISGGGGAPLQPNLSADAVAAESEHHFVLIDIGPARLEVSAVSVGGQLLDRFSIPPGQ